MSDSSKFYIIKWIGVFVLVLFFINYCSEKKNREQRTSSIEERSIIKKKVRIHEVNYQEQWCEKHGGTSEVTLIDGTRSDCVTNEYAVEVDFAKKWAESIGQSLHYSRLTGKRAGILLIVNKPNDIVHYQRLIDNINYYKLPIQVWTINKSELAGVSN